MVGEYDNCKALHQNRFSFFYIFILIFCVQCFINMSNRQLFLAKKIMLAGSKEENIPSSSQDNWKNINITFA